MNRALSFFAFLLIMLNSYPAWSSSIIYDSALAILTDSTGAVLYTKTGPLVISDTETYAYELVDCGDAVGAVGITVVAGATILNATVCRCPGGAYNFTESATLKNSIGCGDGDDITIAAGKTVTGLNNLFSDAASSGAGTYSDAGSTTLWTTNPLFVSTTDFHLQSTSPAINAGVDVGLTQDYDGRVMRGRNIGAYESWPKFMGF